MSPNKNLHLALETALKETLQWPEKGWSMTFGPRQIRVNTLSEAESLPAEFPYRMEAQSYWRRVKATAFEIEQWAKRALVSLEKGDMVDLADSVYFAMVLEKGLHSDAPVWRGIWEQVRS